MKKLIILGLVILGFASCDKWLNVTPKGQVDAVDLLQDQKGYNSALAGIYYILSESSLYGRDLSYSMMDLLARYWDISTESRHNYKGLSEYNYTGKFADSVIRCVWKDLSKCITQSNRILESLEINRQDIPYSELIEAEALGLRAFCHMELFRIFGPVIRQSGDLDKKSIAYRTKFDVTPLEFESGRSVLEKAKADLLAALELAKDDPIQVVGRSGDSNPSLLNFNNVVYRRGSRMNYFAILGMLARVEQYLLNQEGAYTYADRLIREIEQNPVFAFVTSEDLNIDIVFRDYNYSAEMLFSVYNENLYQMTNSIFYMEDAKYDSRNGFLISTDLYKVFLNEIYEPEGGGTDNRLRFWLEAQPSGYYYDLTKLREARQGGGLSKPYLAEIPIMRLPEVYYIACEAQIGKDNALALSYLNKVRSARNLPDLDGSFTDDQLLQSLVRDMRKEFIGEGRMFAAYKRLNYPIYVKQGVTIQPSDQIFVLPIPNDEYEYSPNQKPEI